MTHSSYRYGVVKELSAMPSLVITMIGLTSLEILITSLKETSEHKQEVVKGKWKKQQDCLLLDPLFPPL